MIQYNTINGHTSKFEKKKRHPNATFFLLKKEISTARKPLEDLLKCIPIYCMATVQVHICYILSLLFAFWMKRYPNTNKYLWPRCPLRSLVESLKNIPMHFWEYAPLSSTKFCCHGIFTLSTYIDMHIPLHHLLFVFSFPRPLSNELILIY